MVRGFACAVVLRCKFLATLLSVVSRRLLHGESTGAVLKCTYAYGQNCISLQAQRSELQSLLRLTQSTEEEHSQTQDTASFRTLVLDRHIPQELAEYILALYTMTKTDSSEGGQNAEQGVTVTAEASAVAAGDLEATAGISAEANGIAAEEQATSSSGTVQQSGTAGSACRAGTADAARSAEATRASGAAVEARVLCKQGSEPWTRAMQQAGLPWALQLLAAFARNHQVCLQPIVANTLDVVLLSW